MTRILSILLVLQILAVSSLQAGELTATSKNNEKVNGFWVEKDFRGAANYLCTTLLVEYPNVASESLSALSETYKRAGAFHRLKELTTVKDKRPIGPTKPNDDMRTLKNFLYSEIAATNPKLSIQKQKNGDLIVRQLHDGSERFSFPDSGSQYIDKNSLKYKQILQRYWWYKP